MTNRSLLRVGILQVTGHPALLAGGLDLLREVFPRDPSLRIDGLCSSFPSLRRCQAGIKADYLRWATDRLKAIISALQAWGPPDILLLPECLVPLESLEALKNYSAESNSIVLGGTHSRPQTAEADRRYVALGIQPEALTTIPATAPGLLPIFLGDEAILRQKLVPSPFEASEVDLAPEDLPTLPVFSDKSRGLVLGPLICAEALRRPHFERRPSLVAIVANDQNPTQFDPHIHTFVSNKHVVAMANEAKFGGSGVFLLRDERALGWWFFEPPLNGRLPVGEGYLEVHVKLDVPAPQRGTTAPGQAVKIHRLASIFGQDDPIRALEQRALEAARDKNGLLLHAICKELDGHQLASALTRLRWHRLLDLIEAETATPAWIEALGESICTEGTESLSTLERAAACRVHRELQAVIADPPAVQKASREVAGDLLLRSQKFATICDQGQPGAPSVSTPPKTEAPIDRADLVRLLRQDLGGPGRSIILTVGGPGVGKTTVLNAAFNQSGIAPIFVECPDGASPDYLYEYLVRAAGYVPSGEAPRSTFSSAELGQALQGARSIWFANAQNLVDEGRWRVESLSSFFESLIEGFAATEDTVAIVFETTRDLPLLSRDPVRLIRRRVPVLPQEDALDVFRLRTRQGGIPDDSISEEQRVTLVRLLDGHPFLIGLAADACSRTAAADVIRDIQGRGKLYRSMASALVAKLHMSEAESSCLAALTRCRAPVPAELLQYVVTDKGTVDKVVAGLGATSIVSRRSDDTIETASFLRNTSLASLALERRAAVRFHDAATRYFVRVAKASSGAVFLRFAVEANYHAASAARKAPFEVQGIRDGLVAAARQHYKRDEFELVIQLLEPLIVPSGVSVSDDVLSLLADAYAWSNRTADSLRLAKQLIAKSTAYRWLIIEAGEAALSSRRLPDAEKALREAEALGIDDYRFHQLRAKIKERHGMRLAALADYEDAAAKAVRDAWPFFFFARCLRRLGRPQEALAAIDSAREYANEQMGVRLGERLEGALLSEEMYCLVLLGNTDAAADMARVLLQDPKANTETIVSAAYVEAATAVPADEKTMLDTFDRALSRLAAKDSEKAHTKATIALLRGKLLERVGNTSAAEKEYEHAAECDPYNAHMKECQLRLLFAHARRSRRLGQNAAASIQARDALQVAKALLKISPANEVAREAQADLFDEFGLQ